MTSSPKSDVRPLQTNETLRGHDGAVCKKTRAHEPVRFGISFYISERVIQKLRGLLRKASNSLKERAAYGAEASPAAVTGLVKD
jgi:hypothetical protein